jgi:hypothetical protein
MLNTKFAPSLTQSGGLVRPEKNAVPYIPATTVNPWDRYTYPWLAWNNRPFVSHYELMQVPVSSPGRLLHEFSITTDDTPGNPYKTDSWEDFRGSFGHLLNFMHGDQDPQKGMNLALFLDLFEVTSRYVGTQKYYSPQLFTPGNLTTPTQPESVREFAAPFNRVSQFRDPGRVNANTIGFPAVWEAIEPSVAWDDFRRSRQGGDDITKLPSLFSNPFRAASSAHLMPKGLEKEPAQATLLRAHPSSANEPLFQANPSDPMSSRPYRNRDRNSYFKYEKIQRLGNLLTTHSNVYAVWITVGYFEVTPWNRANPMDPTLPPTPDPAHPDGMQLGRELGSETGQIKRHRGFYIIDRSIPVGYQRGENHNVENAILLKRLVE